MLLLNLSQEFSGPTTGTVKWTALAAPLTMRRNAMMMTLSSHDRPREAPRRSLPGTDLTLSPVALGCWPMAGITTLGANENDSLATIAKCGELGINHLDTAYAYGYQGESERLISRAVGERRERFVIASKGGLFWSAEQQPAVDGRPATLLCHCEASLERLKTDYIDLYYLHVPDPTVPVAESAGAIRQLIESGKVRFAGASNCTVAQLQEFQSACPLSAVQSPYNMLQRDLEFDILPWCRQRNIGVLVYWPFMKGLLAGRLDQEQPLENDDPRNRYPMYQGEEWRKNQAFVERLREIATAAGRTVAQLVVNWTISQPGVTVALCGAKRAWQIVESAGGTGWQLTADQRQAIDAALVQRGPVAR